MDTSNSLSQQQDLKQTQTLAPQQLASLSLLTLPVMELENRITAELAQNPVLEISEDRPDASDEEQFPESLPEDEGDVSQYDNMLDANREDYEEHLAHVLESEEPETGNDEAERRRQFLFDSITAETSLQETLLEQLRFADAPEKIRACAEYVIGSLDENGYFQGTLADAAQAAGADMNEAQSALELVQSFEPPGIAARDLKECLLLQAARFDPENGNLSLLIRDHLEELARNKLPQIAAAMQIRMNELNGLIAELRQFSPHPGASVDQHNEPYIIPEVTVVPDGDEFRLLENEPPFGHLSISRTYQKMLENPSLAAEDRTYLRSKIEAGKTLIHGLEQRKSTIRRIAELIVNNQYDFMKYGPRALKPMTMRQAADKLGLHETTVKTKKASQAAFRKMPAL